MQTFDFIIFFIFGFCLFTSNHIIQWCMEEVVFDILVFDMTNSVYLTISQEVVRRNTTVPNNSQNGLV